MILFTLISLSCISAADNNTSYEIIGQDNGMDAEEIVGQTNLYGEKILTDGEIDGGALFCDSNALDGSVNK